MQKTSCHFDDINPYLIIQELIPNYETHKYSDSQDLP